MKVHPARESCHLIRTEVRKPVPKPRLSAYKHISRSAASLALAAVLGGSALPAQASQFSPTDSGATGSDPTASVTRAVEGAEQTLRLTDWPGMTGFEPMLGVFAVNGTARAYNGMWDPTPTKFAYQWLSNGKPISGATGSTYKITQNVVGTHLSLQISASREGYETYVHKTLSRPVVQTTEPTLIGLPPTPVGGFADVSSRTQFAFEIRWMAAEGISRGWADNTYRPLEPVRRDAMSAFMYRLADQSAFAAPAKSPFKDVSAQQQFFTEMSWLASTGVSTGWDDGTYRPLKPVNRDAMAAFLYRLAGSPAFNAPEVSPFKDVSTSNQFYKEISWLSAQGISAGWVQADDTRLFQPYEPVKRDAMAAFMYRFDQLGYALAGK